MEKTNKKILPILTNNIVQIVIVVIFIAAAYVIGSLWTKVQILEKGGSKIAQVTVNPTGTNQPPAQPKIEMAQVKDAFNKAVIKFGDANRKLIALEISDPSCPYCQIAGGKNKEVSSQAGDQFKLVADGGTYVPPVPELKKLVDQGKTSFALVYTPGHGNGEMGMKALYCAFEKGKFWEADDLIMSNAGYNLMNNTVKNDKSQSGVVADFLKSAVDPTFMKSCLDSGKYDKQLSTDQSLASGLGINGTPGFFINTTVFAGAYSFKDMQSTVDSALK